MDLERKRWIPTGLPQWAVGNRPYGSLASFALPVGDGVHNAINRVVFEKLWFLVNGYLTPVQPVPWKMRLEMVIGMQIEILNGIKKLPFLALFKFSTEKSPRTIVS